MGSREECSSRGNNSSRWGRVSSSRVVGVIFLGGFAVDIIDVDVLWLQILLLVLAILFLVLWMKENRKTQN